MRIAWFAWLGQRFGEYGYSEGPLRGTIGTVAVLLTALLLSFALRRHRPAALIAAGLTATVGVGWLAFH